MIRKVTCRIAVAMIFALLALPALADGEQIEGGGTRWVDPVVFFKLQDITTSDLQSNYRTGNIDINKVIKKKGVKIYGMRLKPVAAAGIIPSEIRRAIPSSTIKFNYYNNFGVEGIALHEAGFCIYADEGVNRTYDYDYSFDVWDKMTEDHIKAHGVYTIKSLTMVPKNGGIDFSYAFEGKDKYSTTTIYKRGKSRTVKSTENMYTKKSLGVNSSLSRFMYFNGGNRLLLVLGGGNPSMVIGSRRGKAKSEYANKPWHRVYFEVEEIQVDAAVAAAEEGEELPPDEEGKPQLTDEDKQELKDYIDDLATWLKGEGDPLGLGEHTSAKEGAVVGAIGTVASILLGSGLAGFVGGTGAQIASNITNTIIGGGGNPMPPSLPERPEWSGTEPRRPEDEGHTPQEPDPGPDPDSPPPAPADDSFKPTFYPDYCDQYIRETADGGLVMRDPVTNQDIKFFKNDEGLWENEKSGVTYTNAGLEENLRYRVENSGELRYIAEKAARDTAEQHAMWEAQNERDRERGYSDEMKEYRDWKDEQERIQKKEEYIEKLADKYHTTTDKLRDKISQQQSLAEEESHYQQAIAQHWDNAIAVAEIVDKGAEVTINIMGECVPGGKVVKNAYTLAKSTLVAASEAVAEGKDLKEGLAHVAVGMGQGALGVIQNQAGDLTKNPFKEYAIVIGTESVKEGMGTYAKTGDLGKTFNSMLDAGAKKTGDFLTGKAVSWGIGNIKKGADLSLTDKQIHIDNDNGLRFSPKNAEFIKKWLGSGPKDMSKATNFKGWNITDANGNFTFSGTSNVSFGGQIEIDKIFEAGVPELMNQAGAHDWEGTMAVGLKNDAVDFGKNYILLIKRVSVMKN